MKHAILQALLEADFGHDQVVAQEMIDHLEGLEVLQHRRFRLEDYIFEVEYR